MKDPVAAAFFEHAATTALPGTPAMRRAVILDVFATMDAGDLDGMVAHMTDDVVTQFGNQPDISGKTAFRALYAGVSQAFSGLHHEVLSLWHAMEDFNAWIVLLNVTYRRNDGSAVTLPCCNVFRMRGDLIREYRVYMDLGPVLGGATDSGV